MTDTTEATAEEKLRAIVRTIDAANAMTEPLSESVNNLLRLSAEAMNSEAASVIIRDGDEGDLRFLTAVGQVADQLEGMRIPAGKGIAGFVFSSGQPMVVADVGQEQSFYDAVDKETGYNTQTILATPLRYKEEIIGVLEYVNRKGDPPYESFTAEEMDKAAFYAEAIASLVNAYESAKIYREIGKKMFETSETSDIEDIRNRLKEIRSCAKHRETVELAVLVREIGNQGENERKFCKDILESFLRYSQTDRETTFFSR